MAYLVDSEDRILAFKADSTIPGAGEIGFWNIDDSNVKPITIGFVLPASAPEANSSLQPGQRYLLRIWYDGINNMNMILLGANSHIVNSCNEARYTTTTNTNSMIWYLSGGVGLSKTLVSEEGCYFTPFSPLGRPFALDVPLLATLNGRASFGRYVLLPSSDYIQVGYASTLPSSLGNCSSFGCPNGLRCNSFNECVLTNPICGTNSICTGPCYGRCPTNSTCVKAGNGRYFCLPNQDNWAWLPLVILFLFGFILLIILLGVYLVNRQTKATAIVIDNLQSPSSYQGATIE